MESLIIHVAIKFCNLPEISYKYSIQYKRSRLQRRFLGYLDDLPDLKKQLSKILHNNLYKRDYFIAEADTLIAKDKIRFNLGTHNSYGIDTVRNPLWSVYWFVKRHDEVVREIKWIGFKTGDFVGIDIDTDGKPTVYRL